MNKFVSILFWSIIAAAFIGPGTITTAASSGAGFGLTLLWALVFSTLATMVLQEASARLTLASGLDLGTAIHREFSSGIRGVLVHILVLGAIVFGCAAYEAGNIIGGAAGASLGTGLKTNILTLLIGATAGLVLWLGTTRVVAYVLSILVAFMGLVFLVTALVVRPSLGEILSGSFVPHAPSGSGLLILGLIGTTVVPYNLFLGSGIARGQTLSGMRFGLWISVGLGGLISMAVLVVGTASSGSFSFEGLAQTLEGALGSWAGDFFSFGLCAAGVSSAITAPLAAAVTARALLGGQKRGRWDEKGTYYRAVWMGVLFVGVVLGLTGIKPVPAIILAQAFNGVVLPFAAIFLLLVVNDHRLMGSGNRNGPLSNTLMSLVVFVSVMLGISNLLRAFSAATGGIPPEESRVLVLSTVCTVVLGFPVFPAIRSRRKRASDCS